MAISDYNRSAALNLLLGSIAIGPGMEREKVNNAFQQVLADLAAFYEDEFSNAAAETPEKYGAVGDGVANDTGALTAMYASGAKYFVLRNTYKISGTVAVPTGSITDGRGSGKILVSTANVTALNIASVTGVTIRNLQLQSTVAGALANVSGITIDQSTYCDIIGCTITGFQWAGVLVADASYVRVVGNSFGTMLGTVADASDIHVYYDSDNVLVADNFCFGARTVGINIQDPGGAGTYLPRQVTVRNNIIGAHTVFGINVYVGSPVGTVRNSDIIVEGNFVEGITGAGNTSNGMGIYCVGNGLGGLRVVNNRVKNCCTATLDRTNGPAGITISGFGQTAGLTGTAVSPIVSGNNVDGMTQGDGILIVSCLNGVTLGANNATLASSNNGSGAGGATLVGQALRIQNSNLVNVTGGFYTNAGSSDAIFVFASDASNTDISLTNIQVKTATGFGLRTSRNSTYTITRFNVNGITGTSGGGAIQTDAVVDGTINGFVVASAGSTAADIERTTATSFSNCRFSGTTAVLTVGTCTGSTMDKSNILTGLVSNSGTGMLIERYGTAAPVAGTGANGDFVKNSVSTVGQPKGWECTVAATPGTWVSIGNL